MVAYLGDKENILKCWFPRCSAIKRATVLETIRMCVDVFILFLKTISTDPQTAAGEVDGVNLEEIREFAKAFKIRRLSLGLTQTQVGQALSATEGPAYSQSAICR